MKVVPTPIAGCLQILPNILADERGVFVKTFHEEVFRSHGLVTGFAEEYYTVSYQRVLRGLHFQLPPQDHTKLVYCVDGAVLDAVLDLRCGSPTFGQHALIELNAEKRNLLYLPNGLAHGFYTLSKSAVMLYKVTTTYSPANDTGILWNSAGIPWPDTDPVTSVRDEGFVRLQDFRTPFGFGGA